VVLNFEEGVASEETWAEEEGTDPCISWLGVAVPDGGAVSCAVGERTGTSATTAFSGMGTASATSEGCPGSVTADFTCASISFFGALGTAGSGGVGDAEPPDRILEN